MAQPSRLCFLRCIKSPERKISLPHRTPVILGRNEETGITDLHVSRSHLEITADTEAGTVVLKTLGKCYSGCNGYALMQGETYNLKHGDRIAVRLGFHEYDVIFDDNEETPAKKAKLDNSKTEPKTSNSGAEGKWEHIDGNDLLVYTAENCTPRRCIAAFDLDGTIIKTKSGARFPKDFDDWTLNFGNTKKKLEELHEDNHKLVVFTNQSGIGNDTGKVKGFKKKVENIVKKLSLPMQVYIATGKSIYRKPTPGMWNTLCQFKNGDVQVDLTKCFYVGDAAGREKNWAPKKNKDHSIADRLFALNIGVRFHTPEEFFLKASSVPHIMPEFDPRNIPETDYPEISASSEKEIILMVGSPGSGKSYYCKKHLLTKGYVHVSRDKLGSWQKCVKVLEESLQKNESVVVDNTNPDKDSRQKFIEVAKKYGVTCKCFVMTTSHKHAKHNNKFRELTDKSHNLVGDIVINSFKKAYQEPELSEGFSEIVKIPFIPKFENTEHEKLYKLFLLES